MNDTKKVAVFATSYLPFTGGAQVAIDELAKRLTEFEFMLFCCRLDRKLPKREMINRVEVHRIGIGYGVDRLLLPLLGPFAALRSVGRRAISWGMMAQYGGFAALLYRYLCGPRCRFVLTLQEGGEFGEMERKAGALLPLMKTVVRKADTLHTISAALMTWGKKLGFAGKACAVIPNGVDVAKFSQKPPAEILSRWREKLAISPDHLVIFSASRFSPKNGMIDAVSAMQFLPSRYLLVIAGNGKQEGAVRERIRVLNIEDRVRLLGDRRTEEIVELLYLSHVFLRPSLSEGLGNAFLEAMAAGVPVVATMVGGIKDFLVPGVNGLAAEPGDPRSIAQCIQQYRDQEFYRGIVESGRRLVKEKFSWDLVSKEMATLFDEQITRLPDPQSSSERQP